MRTPSLSQTPRLCTLQPLKSGHLTNRDTFFCPKCVQIREVPLNIIINCCVSILAVSIDADDPENEVGIHVHVRVY